MARELASGTGVDQMPSRYAEQRAPQFTGGSVDPTSGNIVPSTRDEIANRNEAAPPIPARPTTNLASISAAQPSGGSSSGLGSVLGSAAINVGSSLLGKAAGGLFSSGGDSNKSGPNAGGFTAGGGTSQGGSQSPFNLNPSGTATGPGAGREGLDATMLNGGNSFNETPTLAPSGAATSQGAIPAGYDPSASVPNFTPSPSSTSAPDYSKLPNGAYTDTGYMTANGFQPYASDLQKQNFTSGNFGSNYTYYAPSQIPSSGEFSPGGDASGAGASSAPAFEPAPAWTPPGDSGGGDFWSGFGSGEG